MSSNVGRRKSPVPIAADSREDASGPARRHRGWVRAVDSLYKRQRRRTLERSRQPVVDSFVASSASGSLSRLLSLALSPPPALRRASLRLAPPPSPLRRRRDRSPPAASSSIDLGGDRAMRGCADLSLRDLRLLSCLRRLASDARALSDRPSDELEGAWASRRDGARSVARELGGDALALQRLFAVGESAVYAYRLRAEEARSLGEPRRARRERESLALRRRLAAQA